MDPRGGYVTKILYVKMKESGPAGGRHCVIHCVTSIYIEVTQHSGQLQLIEFRVSAITSRLQPLSLKQEERYSPPIYSLGNRDLLRF